MENNPPPAQTPPPPVIALPVQQVRPRTGRGWMVATFLLAGLVMLLFLTNVIQGLFGWAGSGSAGCQTGRWLEEITVEHNGSGNKIAIIDVEGIITSMAMGYRGRNMVELIEDQLEMAADDRAVKAVILNVDSPGGEVMASDDISRALLDFQEKHRKPIVAAMGGLGASGGYYVSAPCQWIVANELTMTGSIGVIMSTFNYRGLLDKVGVLPQVFKSGRFKDMLRGSKLPNEVEPEEREMIQAMVDQTHAKFLSVVQDGRKRAQRENQGAGKPLADNWKEFADGRILTGKQAFDLGFVDELGGFEAAVKRARAISKIPEANLIRYEEPFGLSSLLPFFGKSDQATIKVDLGYEMPKLEAGRLYFLAPTVIH
ncbi:MAG: signal peptide peptidase SppA [Verrucomicrobiia bacterium]